ncbi:MAG: CHAT domain-containing protein [Herpetosiphonaceae bacterium]|nr:CHAT domain-containing protein [Herpetosiphonaceae bacterium]
MAELMEYDELILHFKHSGTPGEERYQVALLGRGLILEGGLFRQQETFSATELQAVRADFTKFVEEWHTLERLGFPGRAANERPLIDLGARVACVLPPQTRRSLRQAIQHTHQRQHGLRVVIRVEPDALVLMDVPWELMVLPTLPDGGLSEAATTFIFLDAKVVVVRQVAAIGQQQPLCLNADLRPQIIVAQPLEASEIKIDLIRTALTDVVPVDATTWYEGVGTVAALQTRLREHVPRVLHVICHGGPADTGRGLRYDLLFTHHDGYTQRVNVFDLAPTLSLDANLQLVLLDACHSGASQADDARRASESIALGLVRYGIPVVVALQGEIGQEAAAAFVATFYGALHDQLPLAEAVAQGRLAIQALGSADWSLPVIYEGCQPQAPAVFYTRWADRIEQLFHDRASRRVLRGMLVVLGILLITGAILYAVVLPPPAAPSVGDQLFMAAQGWGLVGIVAPSVIAAAHRGTAYQRGKSGRVQRMLRTEQWLGAYLGYILGGLMGWTLLVAGYFLGLLTRGSVASQRSIVDLFIIAVVAWSLLLSYAQARSLGRLAAQLVDEEPALFTWRYQWAALVAFPVLLSIPLDVRWMIHSPLALLTQPVPGGLALGLLLLTPALLDE